MRVRVGPIKHRIGFGSQGVGRGIRRTQGLGSGRSFTASTNGLITGARWALKIMMVGMGAWGCAPPLDTMPPVPEPGISDVPLFADDFQSGEPRQWTPFSGEWGVKDMPTATREYLGEQATMNLSVAGSFRWTDYHVQARVMLLEGAGSVGVLGRVQGTHHYYELLLGPTGAEGVRSWSIRRRVNHVWTTLASGAFNYDTAVPYVLRFNMRGGVLEGLISLDDGQLFTRLGSVSDTTFTFGKIGLASYLTPSTFDNVAVEGVSPITSALALGPWGPIAALRDDTNRFPTGKPVGGWYVTPIHATLHASDGSVVISGFGRKAEASCTGTTQRQVGETFVINPSAIDAVTDGDTLLVQSIDQQNLDTVHDVLYCSGQTTMADGRIFLAGGTKYPDTLPDSSPELGLTYSRVYNPTSNSIQRVSFPTKGGQTVTRGMKWYPTTTLLPDGRVLTFGGFHWFGGGTGVQKNQSLEAFDPNIWDANPAADPYTVLTQHEEGNAETPPARSYTNVFVLPKSVPAASAGGGFARSMVVSGSTGRVFLFNHEPGPAGNQRLIARSNALSTNPATSLAGSGTATAMLPDGRIMFANGSADGVGSSRAYFYDAYADNWTTLSLGISRYYGDAVWLPDGTILLANGYVNEPGSDNIVSPLGAPDGVRQVQIIDPFAGTVSTQPVWPEPTGRGYHNVALLLKDARILIGGGKDGDHNTGCEKNELRIYTPPYLSAGPRPTITNVASGQTLVAAGGPLTITYTDTVRSTRGVALMAPGSMTHGFDQGQRYIPLTPTVGPSGGSVTVALPASVEQTPPGDYLLYVVSDLGVPSMGVHVRVAAPPACVYAVNGGTDSYIEVENSSRRAGPFLNVSDATSSAGAHIQVDPTSTGTTTVPDEERVMRYDVDVSSGGNFFVWLLANGPDTDSDSVYVSIDGNADQVLNLPAGVWGWVRAATAVNIPNGRHTVKLKSREPGAKIDKLRLTTSTSTTPPAGTGGIALSCMGPAIAGLAVNDTAAGGDGIANNTQWSIQPGFAGGGGQLAFGDRTYTIGALPAAATHFNGKPWIRTAADTKNYRPVSPLPPVAATSRVYGSFVFIAIDSRHTTTPLTNAGYVSQGYALTVNEGTTPRTYNVWRKSIVPGTSVALPSLLTSAGPFYLVIAE